MELTENIYFRNVNNNAGIFDYLIATAEDQETKEAALAYHFIREAEVAPTATEIAGRVETWLAENFAVNVDFKIADALDTLDRFGLVRREGDRLFVPPLEAAIVEEALEGEAGDAVGRDYYAHGAQPGQLQSKVTMTSEAQSAFLGRDQEAVLLFRLIHTRTSVQP
jgi:hypothetical protein